MHILYLEVMRPIQTGISNIFLASTQFLVETALLRKHIGNQETLREFILIERSQTTCIEAVRDKYREKYGIDEEFPVLKTEFGNIAVSTVQGDPFIFAAFAMKGVEIMLRTATLFDESDVRAMSWSNNFYSAMANITLPLGGPYSDSGGKSIITAPNGDLLAKNIQAHMKKASSLLKYQLLNLGRIEQYPTMLWIWCKKSFQTTNRRFR